MNATPPQVELEHGITSTRDELLPQSILGTSHTLSSISLNGNSVAFTIETINGNEYAIFPITAGSYQATFEQ